MGSNNGGVEHLHQVSGLGQSCQCLKGCLGHANLTQAPEAFPYPVPVAEALRQGPPADVADGNVKEALDLFHRGPSIASLGKLKVSFGSNRDEVPWHLNGCFAARCGSLSRNSFQ